jgi:hypothetical protein
MPMAIAIMMYDAFSGRGNNPKAGIPSPEYRPF